MAYMKYINTDKHGMVIFQQHITHKEIADMLKLKPAEIKSAGFISTVCDADEIRCSGESVSLGKRCRTSDSDDLYRNISLYE